MRQETRIRMIRLAVLAGLLLLGLFAALFVFRVPEGILARLLHATHAEITAPSMYGAVHILCLALLGLLVAAVLLLHGRIGEGRLDGIVFGVGCFFLVIELYKQLYYHTVLGNGHYNFAVLPLQLCSYVLYLYPIVPLLPEGRVKDVLYRFSAFYLTAAGAIVMFCPLFYDDLFLTVHTVVWHTVMVLSGLLILLLRGYGRRYFSEILPAAGVFLGIFALGLSLNVILAPLTENSVGPLNLFYLSPYGETNNLIIGDVRDALGWFPAVVTYAVLITAVTVNAVWAVGRLVRVCRAKMKGKGEPEGGTEQNG